MRRILRSGPYLGAIGIVVMLGIGFLGVFGYDVGAALGAWWRGAFGSTDAFVSSTLVRAVPLVLIGSGVALAFRVGVFNIGGDGQFLAGAAASTWVVLLELPLPSVFSLPLAIAVGGFAGALWGLVPAIMRWRWGVFEVLSTLMMNFIAVYLISYLVRGPLQEPTRIYPQSPTLDDRLPLLVPGTRLHAGFLIAIVCAVALWIWTTFRFGGVRARLTGANAIAAESAGQINTQRMTLRVFMVSAALCGVAGAVEVLGVTFALYENLSAGYGYTAIAVALLAGLNPLGIVVSGVLLAGLDAGAAAMQREAGVPSVAAWVIQALLVLAVLATSAITQGSGRLLRFGTR